MSQDGSVHIYNLQNGQWVSSFQAASGTDVPTMLQFHIIGLSVVHFLFCVLTWAGSLTDTINGFSFHPFFPMAASSSGQRRFCGLDEDSSGEAILNGILPHISLIIISQSSTLISSSILINFSKLVILIFFFHRAILTHRVSRISCPHQIRGICECIGHENIGMSGSIFLMLLISLLEINL